MQTIRYILTIMLLVAFSTSMYSQQSINYTFHGIVKTEGQPEQFCNIKVYEAGKLTDYSKSLSNGYFKLSLRYGSVYKIEFTKNGYQNSVVNIATNQKPGKNKLSSNIFTINLSKTPQKEQNFNIGSNGKLSATEKLTFASSGPVNAQNEMYADAKAAKLKASITADSIIEAAYREKAALMAGIPQTDKPLDSLSAEDKSKLFESALNNETILPDSLFSDEERAEVSRKSAEIEPILKKSILNTEDSLSIIENIIDQKELVLQNIKDRLKSAQDNNDFEQAALLAEALKKLEPELEQYKNEAKKYKKQIEKNKQEIAEQNKLIMIVVGFIALLSIALFILGLYYRNKKKSSKVLMEKNTLLNQQKEEIRAQAENLTIANEAISEANNELTNQNTKIENQKKQIEASILYAGSIQRAVLPFNELLTKHFEYFMIYRPKDIVSGDFYWFSELDGIPRPKGVTDMVMMSVADCTGHGVPGAFMSLISIQLLNQIVNEKHVTNPAKILSKLDKGIKKSLQQEKNSNNDGIDMGIVLIMRKENGNLDIEYSGAKRPLWIYQAADKKAISVKANRRSIGGSQKAASKTIEFKSEHQTIAEEDVIYLSTDGYGDQNNNKRKKFGTNKIIEEIEKIGHQDIKMQGSTMENILEEHMKGELQRDDITLMGIKFFKSNK